MGGAQVNENQPLVLLNQGGATAEDVLALASQVLVTVHAMTGMRLAIEPELGGIRRPELAGLRRFENG